MTQDQQQKKADGRDPNREHMTLSELWQLWRDNLMSWRSFCDEHHDLFTLNIQAGFRRIGRWLSDLRSNARALAAANRDRRFPESEYGAAQLFLFFRGSLERRAAVIREGFSNRRKALTWMGGKRRHFFEKMHLHPAADRLPVRRGLCRRGQDQEGGGQYVHHHPLLRGYHGRPDR